MPCYYTGSAEGDAALAATEAKEKLASELSTTTELLCTTLMQLESTSPEAIKSLPANVQTWWKKHKKVDQRRPSKRKPKSKGASNG